jgi:hypothetical protein
LSREGCIVVFGESENDRRAIEELVKSLCPGVSVVRLRPPLGMIKNSSAAKLPRTVEQVAKVVKAEEARRAVACVFAHEDADATEPAHEAMAERIEAALRGAGIDADVHAVVPAWEIEAWWFMWPDVVANCNVKWRQPKSTPQPGLITDAKEVLSRAVRPPGLPVRERRTFPNYRESDSIRIAEAIRAASRADEPKPGTSASYDRFRASVRSCCGSEAA